MTLKNLSPMFYTESIDETVQFYCNILGFECDHNNPTLEWASVKKDDVEIMFCLPNFHIPFEKPQFTGSIYIKSDDVDSVWASVKDKTQTCYPLEDFDYGMREFAIFDNNGYLIQFGQSIAS
jgi:uncharacterized glyoxalase superfamily protein PhnB